MGRRRQYAYRLANTANGFRRCSSIIATTTWSVAIMLLVSSSSAIIKKARAESETDNLILNLETSQESLKNDSDTVTSAESPQRETRQNLLNRFMIPSQLAPHSPAGCTLYDASVYSYCSFKLIHDTCCCDFPDNLIDFWNGSVIYQKPTLCVYADCSLLYAKSCYEHALIKTCCCNNP